MLTVVAIVTVYSYVKLQLTAQQQRNIALEQASHQLDGDLRRIHTLRQQRQQLQARAEVIADYQSQQHFPIQLFNQLPIWVPDTVYLDRVQLSAQGVNISGKAHTHSQLALMVQHIEQSGWLTRPQLQVIALPDDASLLAGGATQQFSLQLIFKEPFPSTR